MDWLAFKDAVTEATGLSRDMLHLLTGVGAHLLLVIAFRSWFGALWPLGLIGLAEIGNEWMDLAGDRWPASERGLQYWESAKDVVTTLAIPLTLVLLSRWAPDRFDRPHIAASEPALPAADVGALDSAP